MIRPPPWARRCGSEARMNWIDRPPFPGAGARRGGGLSVERQLDAALSEDVIGGVDEIEDLAHPGVGDRLVDDLPGLDGRDAGGEGGTEHDPVFAERLGADERRELHHEPGADVKAAGAERLVEGEVVEDLDQLRVGDLQRRDVAGEQLVMVLLRGFADGHSAYSPGCRTRRTVTR